jgi:hypothetical protein
LYSRAKRKTKENAEVYSFDLTEKKVIHEYRGPLSGQERTFFCKKGAKK